VLGSTSRKTTVNGLQFPVFPLTVPTVGNMKHDQPIHLFITSAHSQLSAFNEFFFFFKFTHTAGLTAPNQLSIQGSTKFRLNISTPATPMATEIMMDFLDYLLVFHLFCMIRVPIFISSNRSLLLI
jgi:hypothetical protein